MGRTAYDGIGPAMTQKTDHPFSAILNAGRKVPVQSAWLSRC